MNHSQIVSFLWGVADLIRDTFKRGKYQDVILPLTVLRRLDCVLAPTKPKVLETQAKYKGKLAGKIVLYGDDPEVKPSVEPLSERLTEKALASATASQKSPATAWSAQI